MKETPTSAVSRDDSPAVKLFRPVTPRKLGIKCPASLRNRVQSTCLDDAAHLKTYVRLWVLVEVMLLFCPVPLTVRGTQALAFVSSFD